MLDKIDFNKPKAALDFETFPIGQGPNPTHPKPVVASLFDDAHNNLLIHAKDKSFRNVMEMLLQPGSILIGHNIAYDLGVLYYHYPDLITKIYDKYDRSEIYDTVIAEKFLNLSRIGVIVKGFCKNRQLNFRYDLGCLAGNYLGVNMSEDKKAATELETEISRKISVGDIYTWTEEEQEWLLDNTPGETCDIGELESVFKSRVWDLCGAWRTRYHHLDDIPVDGWTPKARGYALNDSKYTYQVMEKQLTMARSSAYQCDPFTTLAFRCRVAFDLAIQASVGVHTDQDRVDELEKMVLHELSEESLAPLKSVGIYVPEVPPQPYKTNPNKFKKAVPAKIAQEPLKKHVIKMVEEGKVSKDMLIFTPDGHKDFEFMDEFKKVKSGDPLVELLRGSRERIKVYRGIEKTVDHPYWKYISVAEDFKVKVIDKEINDEVFDNYIHFKRYEKLKTTEIPAMKNPIIYPGYRELMETGRVSGYGAKLYPSRSVQVVKAEVRNCYVPRSGDHLMLSCDFSSMELVTAAYTCFKLFGYSILRDKINAGYDTHAYLGSQIALRKDEVFSTVLEDDPTLADKSDEVYKIFISLKGHKEYGWIYDKYRKLAKPVGLGLWGGLGAKTFIKTAKTIYGVEIASEDEARELIAIWHQTYPEAKQYFNYMKSNCKDFENMFQYTDKETGDKKTWMKYQYTSPMGMVRRNCDYCAEMNGMALQTPGAEGALNANHKVVRACFDPSLKSVLYGNFFPWGFIHDEICGDVKYDFRYDVSMEVSRLMVEGFSEVITGMFVKAEPALMRFWDKRAESEVDEENKTITIWEPEDED